jgi:hypothetical protein
MISMQAEFLKVCGSGDVERVKQLLGEGVDINTRQVVSSEFVFFILFISPPERMHWPP